MAVQSFRQMLGAPTSTASSSDSTLIIIDAQNEYAEGHLKVTDPTATRKAIASLLGRYRDAGGRVVHVVHETPAGAPVFTPDTKLAEEFEELKPKANEKVIGKVHPSSFADTELHEYLGGKGGVKLVLTGYMVSRCVHFHTDSRGLHSLTCNKRRTSACRLPHVMRHAWGTMFSSQKTL